MTVGRNSAVTVDRFCLFTRRRRLAGRVRGKGVMRLVGGGFSHEGGIRLRTPTASIGVRGGTALVRVGGSCGTLVHQYGFIDVGSQALTRPGYGVCAPSRGPVSEPFLVPPETTRKSSPRWRAAKTQRGGAKRAPTNEEANLALGNDRPPDVVSPPGLDALVVRRAAPMSTISLLRCRRPRQVGNDGHHDDHDHGGHGGEGAQGEGYEVRAASTAAAEARVVAAAMAATGASSERRLGPW